MDTEGRDGGLRILLVEDDPADVFLARRELRGVRGHELVLAMSLREGLRKLSEGRVDVIITDLDLPDAGGLEAVEQLSQAAPQAALIALTGDQDQRYSVEALRVGAHDYLSKGGGHRTLAESIVYALERKSAQRCPPQGRVLPFVRAGRSVVHVSGEIWGRWWEILPEDRHLWEVLRGRTGRVFLPMPEGWLEASPFLPSMDLGGVIFVLQGRLRGGGGERERIRRLRAAGGQVLLGDAGGLLSTPWVLDQVDGAMLGPELCVMAERAVPLLLLRALVQLAEEVDWLLVGEGSGEGAARLFAAGCPLVVSPR